MSNEKTIIEVNGVKLEVDLRNAKKIENFKVGDFVKILIKDYSSFKPYLGTIIGFDNFTNQPTIIVAYLYTDYSGCEIKFEYINKKSKDVEICQVNEWDIPYTKSDTLQKFDGEIANQEEKLKEIKLKKYIFEKHFGKYFNDIGGSSNVNESERK